MDKLNDWDSGFEDWKKRKKDLEEKQKQDIEMRKAFESFDELRIKKIKELKIPKKENNDYKEVVIKKPTKYNEKKLRKTILIVLFIIFLPIILFIIFQKNIPEVYFIELNKNNSNGKLYILDELNVLESNLSSEYMEVKKSDSFKLFLKKEISKNTINTLELEFRGYADIYLDNKLVFPNLINYELFEEFSEFYIYGKREINKILIKEQKIEDYLNNYNNKSYYSNSFLNIKLNKKNIIEKPDFYVFNKKFLKTDDDEFVLKKPIELNSENENIFDIRFVFDKNPSIKKIKVTIVK